MFSSLQATKKMAALSAKYNKKDIIDLGSGWGTLALAIARKNPQKTVIGYELSPIPFYFSKLLKTLFRQNNLHFVRKDFLTIKFEKDKLYLCYLYPGAMDKLQDKIFQSPFNPLLISNTFAMYQFKQDSTFYLKDLYQTPIYLYSTYTLK